MFKKFLKWFATMFMIFVTISYSIVISKIGLNPTKNIFFNDFFYNMLMICTPSFVVAISLTRWELKNNF